MCKCCDGEIVKSETATNLQTKLENLQLNSRMNQGQRNVSKPCCECVFAKQRQPQLPDDVDFFV
jgi:methyl coenzyme M reductase subunit C